MDMCSCEVASRYLEKLAATQLTDATKWALTRILERGHAFRKDVLSPRQAKQLVAAGLIIDSGDRPGRPHVVTLTPEGERMARALVAERA